MPDTKNVVITAGTRAHFFPIRRLQIDRTGWYTVGRRIPVTIRFHLLPQKFCKEVERYGSSNGGSSSSRATAPTKAATMTSNSSNIHKKGKKRNLDNIVERRQAKRMKWRNVIGGLDELRGPLPKAKRRSLKLASHAMKKAVVIPRMLGITWLGVYCLVPRGSVEVKVLLEIPRVLPPCISQAIGVRTFFSAPTSHHSAVLHPGIGGNPDDDTQHSDACTTRARCSAQIRAWKFTIAGRTTNPSAEVKSRSFNLTVGEPFPENSSGGQTYCCQCAVIKRKSSSLVHPHRSQREGQSRWYLLSISNAWGQRGQTTGRCAEGGEGHLEAKAGSVIPWRKRRPGCHDRTTASTADTNGPDFGRQPAYGAGPGRQCIVFQDKIRRRRSPANENLEGEATLNFGFQTPFSREIEGMDPPEKFVPPKFTLYDGKSDPRSHVSHVRQMMALWNHMDALMCRVFPSNLGDLGLKWFDRLPPGSIENFYQLIESFVAQFVRKYQGTEGRDRLWENLTLDPPTDLRDLMSQVEMFARLEDDVRESEKTKGKLGRGEAPVKRRKNGSNPYETRAKEEVEEAADAEDEDLPLGTIHMIGGPNDPSLESKIRNKIRMIRQMHEGGPRESTTSSLGPISGVVEDRRAPKTIQGRIPIFDNLVKNPQDQLKPARAPLVGFNAQAHWPLGTVSLKTRAGSQELMTEFIVVDIPSPYNAIVGRDWLHRMKGVASTLHQAIKFLTPRGEEAIYGNQVAAKTMLPGHIVDQDGDERSSSDRGGYRSAGGCGS
ncbi:MBOAT (membrane bound O-acyl transferase) family protein [Actinidia rufa]|uniref:MBOAT (Membrane bound O-acyl transferase) family protein n=1 Tax=Actinidia rufa TaxID=165716 RepID=A0A7J0EWA7_9ERIC|nr:MBOAT (membrane bound O-acyl transferase) family protein [Actinidia rufa]